MTPQTLENPIYRCVIDQISSVETFLDHWKRPENQKVEDIEWLVMNVANGRNPTQFVECLKYKSVTQSTLMEALSAINTDTARSKMQGLWLLRLTYEVISLGLLQYLLHKGVFVPKEVVSSYKNSLNAAAEALTGEALNVFK